MIVQHLLLICALGFTSPLLYLVLFLFGLLFGSFFKVVVDRSAKHYSHLAISSTSRKQNHQSWLKGRSCCDHCQHTIAWFDNLPVVSYALLKGRCRYCHQTIDWRYPLTELLTAFLFVFAGFLANQASLLGDWSFLVQLMFFLFVISGLWLIFLFDWRYLVIPDELVLFVAVLSLIKVYYQATARGIEFVVADSIAAGVCLCLFLLLRLIPHVVMKRPGMGWGDIKLIFPLSLLLGYPLIVVAVFCAFIIGGVWGIILLRVGKAKIGQALSFGPLLVLGSFLALGWGEQAWSYYWRMF